MRLSPITTRFSRRCILTTVAAALAFLGNGRVASAQQSPDAIVVCPKRFEPSLDRWVQFRESQGLVISVINSNENSKRLSESIRQVGGGNTKYVILVGDTPVIGRKCDATVQVPTNYRSTTVTKNWGSTPTLASDVPYGDPDGDGIPTAAVGRWPVRTSKELTTLIDRVIAYENSKDFGLWRRRVQLVGGVGGFGALADTAIESVTRTVVTSVLPADTQTHVAYGSPGHRFFPSTSAGGTFTDAVLKNYAQGARFWVYAGHGNVTELDRVPQQRDGVPVLDGTSVSRLDRPASAAPIALMLACYTGAMDASEDSIVERMLIQKGGPIAVFAGTRITMPYGNTTAAVGLIEAIYEQKSPRLGDAWVHALKKMHAEDPTTKSSSRIMIDAIATFVSPAGTKLVDERHEHMLLYNLFGDPTLRLNHPADIKLDVEAGFDLGQQIDVGITSELAGDLTLAIDRPLGASQSGDPNDTNVATLKLKVNANQATNGKFTLPENVTGPLVIRALVAGENSWGSGAARTQIRKPLH